MTNTAAAASFARTRGIMLVPALAAVVVSSIAWGSLRADTRLSAADLRADALILRRAYETLHPGLHRYNTPEQMDAAFCALDEEFASDRTLADAYLAFSVFAAKVKCGHTYANFFNQSDAVAAALFDAPRVPFLFRWLGDRMVVTRAFAAEPRLRAGTEVLAMNDVPVARILAKLMTIARADGSNDAKRVASLQVEGGGRFEAFDIFWPLFFPSADADVILRVRAPGDAREETVRVARIPAAKRLALANPGDANAAADASMWEFRQDDDGIAYLRMPSWAMYNSKWNWRAFLDDTFEALAAGGAQDLVIDLRGNEGGNDIGDVIVSHLVKSPVPRPAFARRVRYRKVRDDLAPYLDTWDPTFNDWGDAAIEEDGGFYRLRRDADDDPGAPIEPEEPTFTGRTWVLIGATNSSATFEFAQMVRRNRLATLVGQPTGGNQRGINGGCFFFLRLPHSGIELDVPLIGQFPGGDPPDAGLEPDVLVVPAIADIAAGRDSELETVRERVRALKERARGN